MRTGRWPTRSRREHAEFGFLLIVWAVVAVLLVAAINYRAPQGRFTIHRYLKGGGYHRVFGAPAPALRLLDATTDTTTTTDDDPPVYGCPGIPLDPPCEDGADLYTPGLTFTDDPEVVPPDGFRYSPPRCGTVSVNCDPQQHVTWYKQGKFGKSGYHASIWAHPKSAKGKIMDEFHHKYPNQDVNTWWNNLMSRTNCLAKNHFPYNVENKGHKCTVTYIGSDGKAKPITGLQVADVTIGCSGDIVAVAVPSAVSGPIGWIGFGTATAACLWSFWRAQNP